MRRPVGTPVAKDLRLETAPTPDLGDGQFLIRNHFTSLDPAMRGWMDDTPSYMPPIALGAPVRASTVGVVVESKAADFPVGQWVSGLNAIEEYSVAMAGGFSAAVDVSIVPSPTNFLSVLGAVGMTAYFGYLEVCKPNAGDVVLVTGAAGAVGSLVGQIAKIKGASKVIGIAGGPEKCARLVDHYGFDVAIDYRGRSVEQLSAEIAAHAPDGVNIIFENVGGIILDAGLNNLAMGARIGLCGLISEYNNPAEKTGARNVWQLIVKRASITGLLVADYVPRFSEGITAMAGWLQSGQIVFDEHIDHGIGGLRWTDEKKSTTVRFPFVHDIITFGFGFLPSGFFAGPVRFSDTNLSPELSLKYKVTDDVNVYAAYKTGFKSGGVDNNALPSGPLRNLNSPDPAVRAAIEDGLRFESETSKGGEIGIRSQFADRSVTLNATAFYYTFKDLQIQEFSLALFNFETYNASKVVTKGLDIDWAWRTPVEGLRFSGAASYTDTKYAEDIVRPNLSVALVDGRSVARAPKFSGNIAFDWRTPLSDAMEIGLRGNATYSDFHKFAGIWFWADHNRGAERLCLSGQKRHRYVDRDCLAFRICWRGHCSMVGAFALPEKTGRNR